MNAITYHWFTPGIDLGKCRRLEGYDHNHVIYEYACGQLGSPFHGPHQMYHLSPRERTRSGELHETNCKKCKAIWDAVDAQASVPRELQLKYFKEVTQRKSMVNFRSAERLDTISYAAQFGEEHPY